MVTSPLISLSTHTTAPGAIFTLQGERERGKLFLSKVLTAAGWRDGATDEALLNKPGDPGSILGTQVKNTKFQNALL